MFKRKVVALAVIGIIVTGCAAKPASMTEVCSGFDALGQQLIKGNGYGNPLFDRINDVADMASRYQGSPSLKSDAARLDQLADADSVSGTDLMNATWSMASLCGHPVAMNALFGS